MREIEEIMGDREYRQFMRKVRQIEQRTGRRINLDTRRIDAHRWRVVYRSPGDNRRTHHRQLPLF